MRSESSNTNAVAVWFNATDTPSTAMSTDAQQRPTSENLAMKRGFVDAVDELFSTFYEAQFDCAATALADPDTE